VFGRTLGEWTESVLVSALVAFCAILTALLFARWVYHVFLCSPSGRIQLSCSLALGLVILLTWDALGLPHGEATAAAAAATVLATMRLVAWLCGSGEL
jgi:hypothetical protein